LDEDLLLDFIEALLLNLPTFAALGGGAVAALVLGRTQPQVRWRTLLGCCWLALVYLFTIAWHSMFERELLGDPPPASAHLVDFLLSTAEAVGFVLLLSAIFTGRYPSSYRRYLEQYPDEDDWPRRRANDYSSERGP
jgi:hypothetical protein